MKTPIYITIAIAVFVLSTCICLHAWFDEMVLVHRVCFHRYNGTAVLIEKKFYEGADFNACQWKPADRPKVDERWDTCRDFNVGETNYQYPEASYTCEQ